MIAERKRAGVPPPAQANVKRHTPYPRPIRLSSEIGEFLLLLAAGTAGAEGWATFERLLGSYYEGTGR